MHTYTYYSKSIVFMITFLFHQILMINVYHYIEFTIFKHFNFIWYFSHSLYFKVGLFEVRCTVFNSILFLSFEIPIDFLSR